MGDRQRMRLLSLLSLTLHHSEAFQPMIQLSPIPELGLTADAQGMCPRVRLYERSNTLIFGQTVKVPSYLPLGVLRMFLTSNQ